MNTEMAPRTVSLTERAVDLAARALVIEPNRETAWLEFRTQVDARVYELEAEQARTTLMEPVQELMRKGVSADMIQSAVADLTT